MIQAAVYLLCFAASVGCAVLLARSYRLGRTPLLLWSAACFMLLALNNFLVVVDLLVLPSIDLLPLRQLAALAGVGVLLFGFVWETE